MRRLKILDDETSTFEEAELVDIQKDKRGKLKWVEVFRRGELERFHHKAGDQFESKGKIIYIRSGDLKG